jgi:hypothetical protein
VQSVALNSGDHAYDTTALRAEASARPRRPQWGHWLGRRVIIVRSFLVRKRIAVRTGRRASSRRKRGLGRPARAAGRNPAERRHASSRRARACCRRVSNRSSTCLQSSPPQHHDGYQECESEGAGIVTATTRAMAATSRSGDDRDLLGLMCVSLCGIKRGACASLNDAEVDIPPALRSPASRSHSLPPAAKDYLWACD